MNSTYKVVRSGKKHKVVRQWNDGSTQNMAVFDDHDAASSYADYCERYDKWVEDGFRGAGPRMP